MRAKRTIVCTSQPANLSLWISLHRTEVAFALYRSGVQVPELALMPIRVRDRNRARFVEFFYLRGRQIPAGGGEVLTQLLLVACADDHARYGGALQQPIQSDLRH